MHTIPMKFYEIHVDMYDNRLEIVSPGGMRDGRQIQNLDVSHVSSNRRNPVIADIFSRLGYAERRGSGLSRIRDSFVRVEDVQFSSDDAVFVVIMQNQNLDVPLSVGDNAIIEGDNALLEGDNALLCMRLISAYPSHSEDSDRCF